jgi:polysaccharide pyruvyl transferase WcaK-like protein
VLLGDVGVLDGRYHTGDEAMLGCAIERLRERDHSDIVVLSANPDDTAARYAVSSVSGFRNLFDDCLDDDERESRLAMLLQKASDDDSASGAAGVCAAAIAAIRDCDGIVITGGGNLTTEWPNLLFERLAAAELALKFGVDLVLTSQSVGPRLDPRHHGAVMRIAEIARVIGVREEGSARLLRSLGVLDAKIVSTPDDALGLMAGDTEGTLVPSGPFVAATFAAHSGLVLSADYVRDAAAVVRCLRKVTGLPVVLIPHEGRLDGTGSSGDELVHESIRTALLDDTSPVSDGVSSLPLSVAEVTLALTSRAALVVSTRYHQVVFAAAAGVPVIGICVDAYAGNKIGGALRDAGLGAWSVTENSISSGRLETLIAETWSRNAEIASHLASGRAAREDRLRSWWDIVADPDIAVETIQAVQWTTPELGRRDLDNGAALAREREWLLSASTHQNQLRAEDYAVRAAEMTQRAISVVPEVAEANAEIAELLARQENLEAALSASHRVAAKIGDPTFAKTLRTPKAMRAAKALRQPASAADGDGLRAVMNSRTMRWTRFPRRVYWLLRFVRRNWQGVN